MGTEGFNQPREAARLGRNWVATAAGAVTLASISALAIFFVSVVVTVYGGFPLWLG